MKKNIFSVIILFAVLLLIFFAVKTGVNFVEKGHPNLTFKQAFLLKTQQIDRSYEVRAILKSFREALKSYHSKHNQWPPLAILNTLFLDKKVPEVILNPAMSYDYSAVAKYTGNGPTFDAGGWMYDETTGKLVINSTALDPITNEPWCSY